MRSGRLAFVVACALAAHGALGEQMVRELWEGVGNGILGGMGSASTSKGFEPGSTWFLNAGTYLRCAQDFNVVEGDPDTIGGLPAQWNAAGRIWGDDINHGLAHAWDTASWATRRLAATAQVNFASNDLVWFSMRINNGGDSAGGLGFASSGASGANYIGAGMMWDNAGGGAANNAVYISQGTLGHPYAISAHGVAYKMSGKGLLVCRLTTYATGSDTLDAVVYPAGTAAPTSPGAIAWDTTHSANLAWTATHLLLWGNGTSPCESDAIRISRSYAEVTGLEIISEIAFLPTNASPAGIAVTVSVSAARAPMSYQWRRDGTNLPGATTSPYVFLPATNGGGNYDVVISNAYGMVTSTVAALTVLPPIAPMVTRNPASLSRYPGGIAVFTVGLTGSEPLLYQWRKDGIPLAGATNAALTVSPVTSGDPGDYDVLITNDVGNAASLPATLTVLSPRTGSYAERVVAKRPYAFWRLDESSGGTAYEYMAGRNGTYEPASLPGQDGVRPPEFPGLEATNLSLRTFNGIANSYASIPALNLNTDSVTIVCWLYQTTAANPWSGLVFYRGGATTAGLNAGGSNDLRYHWNDEEWDFASGLTLPTNEWAMAALVVESSKATLYLGTTGGLQSAVNGGVHGAEEFDADGRIGNDAVNETNRTFNGRLDEVCVFNRALSAQEIGELRLVALGVTTPEIVKQPAPAVRYTGRTATFEVAAAGVGALTYRWRRNGVDLTASGHVAGATQALLTVSSVDAGDVGAYDVVVDSGAGAVTSAIATLTVRALPAAGTYAAAVITNGPVAYYRLDEPTGTNAFDLWGDADAVHTAVAVSQEGPRPSSIPRTFSGFDATNAASGYDGVTSSTETDRNLMNNRTQFTLAGWVLSAGPQDARCGLFGQNDVAEVGYHADGRVGLWTQDGHGSTNGNDLVVFDPALLTAGEWHFLAATADEVEYRVYFDGRLVAFAASDATNFGSSTSPFRIGNGVLDNELNPFDGRIDEVALFDRSLTAQEITNLYAIAVGPPVPPTMTTHPQSLTRYVTRNATFAAATAGSRPFSYQWRRQGAPLTDGSRVQGSRTASLSISALTPADAGDYDCVVTNAGGAVTSYVATLTVLTPTHGGVVAATVNLGPIAYWRLDEPAGPRAVDAWSGHDGTYAAGCAPGRPGVRPPDWLAYESSNLSVETTSGIAASYVSIPALNLNINTFTLSAWVFADGDQSGSRGIVFYRNGNTAAGLNTGMGNELRYTWNDDAATWGWDSGLVLPTGRWVYVAMAVEPARATLYLGTPEGGLQSAANFVPHGIEEFDAPGRIGNDQVDDPGRTFNGAIDEVALYNRTLSSTEISRIYSEATNALTIVMSRSAGSLTLDWDAGTLQRAMFLTSGWTTVTGAIWPHVITPTEPQQFFRAVVP